MDYELEHSRIEQKNRELHKQGAEGEEEKIHSLSKENFDVSNNFSLETNIKKETTEKIVPKNNTPKSMKLLKWFAVIAISGAFSAIGYFVYQFLDPSGRPSEANIIVAIENPIGANPGEPIEIKVKVTNKNNVALDATEILLQLPVGSYEKKADGVISPVREVKSYFGIINAGESIELKANAYILGGEQQLKDINAQLTYRFINMDSTFTKNATSTVRILASPVSVIVDTLKRATAGREVKVTVNVKSNTEVPLQDVLLQIEYPKGFVFTTAEPRPLIGNGLWVIDSLMRSNSETFIVDGMFSSEGSSERVLRTSVGISDDVTSNQIVSKYQEILTPIALEAPFVDITTTYNNKNPDDITAKYGVRMSGGVLIRNNSNAPITHATVEVSIEGSGLDEKSIETSKGGIYRPLTSSIFWDERNDNNLANIAPGQSVSFTFSFVPDAGRTNGKYVANPEISTNVSVKAERENELGVVGEVRTLSSSIVKVATEAEFASRLLFYSGPIKNVGELPPKADKDTQLTVIWSIRNTSNTLDGAEIRASLPPQVSWANVVFPTKEVVRYDSALHEVIWQVGSVPAGTGVGSVSPREVAFQVVLTPSSDDVGKYPVVISNQLFRARDSFTLKAIELRSPNLNTTLSSDSKAGRNSGKVLE